MERSSAIPLTPDAAEKHRQQHPDVLLRHSGNNDRFRANLLIQSHGRSGKLREARAVFDGIQQRNIHSWAIMLAAYAHNGFNAEAITLFPQMHRRDGLQPDAFVFATVLAACANCGALAEGKAIHAQILNSGLQPDVVLGTAIVNMYAKSGALDQARWVFDQMLEKNVVTWTAMITAFAQEGQLHQSLQLFRRMDLEGLKQNDVTFITLLGACCCPQSLSRGQEIHARIVTLDYNSDIGVQNALINMYLKCGSLATAVRVFDAMQERDLTSWNEMILGHTQSGQNQEAVEFFGRLNLEGFRPNDFTFSNILAACSAQQGIVIHHCIVTTEFASDTIVQNSLLNMYAKAGKLDLAKLLFEGSKQRSLVSWTAMITAYAQHGYCDEALGMFQEMNLEGFQPDDVTFISILNACCHSGLLYQGWYHYVFMSEDHQLALSQLHHACMIDLLVKAGWMEEAEELLRSLPCRSDPVLWRIVLNACVMHGHVERAARVAKTMSELNSSPYVLLANVYRSCSSSSQLR